MHTFDPLCVSSDLPGVNPATLNGMILYYRLMTKWSGLGDSTKLFRMGLSHPSRISAAGRGSRGSALAGTVHVVQAMGMQRSSKQGEVS
jgi:hypothetical protein